MVLDIPDANEGKWVQRPSEQTPEKPTPPAKISISRRNSEEFNTDAEIEDLAQQIFTTKIGGPHTPIKSALGLTQMPGSLRTRNLKIWTTSNTGENVTKVTFAFDKTFTPTGKGSAGQVQKGMGVFFESKSPSPVSSPIPVSSPVSFVRKISHTATDFEKLRKGNEVIENLLEKYNTDELEGILKPFEWIDEPDMTAYGHSYIGNLATWEEETDPYPKDVLTGFLSALKGLDILQKERIIHIDLKIQNLLAKDEDVPHFVIADFDGVFSLPLPEDSKKTLEQLLDHLDRALFNSNGTAHTPEYTPQYTPKAEIDGLTDRLASLRNRDPPPSKEEILKLSEEAANISSKIQIFQMGCLITEMMTGESIDTFWRGEGEFAYPEGDIITAWIEAQDIPEEAQAKLIPLLTKMTDKNPNQRPSLDHVISELKEIIQLS